MKNFLRTILLALSLLALQSVSAWTLYVTNWVNKPVNIHTSWAGSGWAFGKCFSCCDDHATIQPGQRIEINAGACLLKELRVDGGTSYTSSGGQRRYDEFYILGPVNNTLYAGHFGKTRHDMSGKLKLLNATQYPATNITIGVAQLTKNWNVNNNPIVDYREILLGPIPAGRDFEFDVPPNYYVRRIDATVNGKNVVKQYNSHPTFFPDIFFISGPPDGSNPKLVQLTQ